MTFVEHTHLQKSPMCDRCLPLLLWDVHELQSEVLEAYPDSSDAVKRGRTQYLRNKKVDKSMSAEDFPEPRREPEIGLKALFVRAPGSTFYRAVGDVQSR